MPFPSQINVQPAPGVAGDFASTNPRVSVLAGPAGFVAGQNGLTVGRFAWVDEAYDGLVSNTGIGPVTGFVHREQQALITAYLGEASNLVPTGFPVTLMSSGDFWVKNEGTTEALVGQTAYASYADGRVSFAAAGSPGTASAATSSIAPATAIAVTASIAPATGEGQIEGSILTVSAITGGAVVPGAILTGTNVPTGLQVTSQISGTAGGIGVYQVNIPEVTVASEAMAGTYGLATLGTVTGQFGVGDTLSGTGVTAGTTVWGFTSGSGGSSSVVIVSPSQTASSTTITAGISVATKFVAMSAGAPGELIKMSSHLLG